jgi:hypothetical protein
VSDVDDASVYDESDAPFTYIPGIGAAPNVVVTGASGLELAGAYPNPFADRTQLRWHQPVSGAVIVRLYNTNGGVAREIDLGVRTRGDQSVVLDGADLPSGTYVYELRVGDRTAVGRLSIVR